MITTEKLVLKAEVTIDLPVEKAWKLWTDPKHIVNWNNAFDSWVTRWAENDLRIGGKFFFRMETLDESSGFDYQGEYSNIVNHQKIESVLSDGRRGKVEFWRLGSQTLIVEIFEVEENNSAEMQQQFCQSVLESFRHYAELSA